jgi:hypothetical protein
MLKLINFIEKKQNDIDNNIYLLNINTNKLLLSNQTGGNYSNYTKAFDDLINTTNNNNNLGNDKKIILDNLEAIRKTLDGYTSDKDLKDLIGDIYKDLNIFETTITTHAKQAIENNKNNEHNQILVDFLPIIKELIEQKVKDGNLSKKEINIISSLLKINNGSENISKINDQESITQIYQINNIYQIYQINNIYQIN